MDWSILIGASQLSAGAVCLWLISFVLLLAVRFSLCAEKWEGFITLKEWFIKGCYTQTIIHESGYREGLAPKLDKFPYFANVDREELLLRPQRYEKGWAIVGLRIDLREAYRFVDVKDPEKPHSKDYSWCSIQYLENYYETKEQCLEAMKTLPLFQESKPRYKLPERVETKNYPYVLLTLPVMLLALVADLFLYALLLSPVVTLTVSGIVLTVTCSRFLSSKLADNIQQTKVNTDDIKNLQSNKENES